MMRISDLSSYYRGLINNLADYAQADSLWKKEAEITVFAASLEQDNIDEMLDILHAMQRIERIFAAGLEQDAELKKELEEKSGPLWSDFTAPPVSLELQTSLAEKLYYLPQGKDHYAGIVLGDGSREIGPWLIKRCLSDEIPFIVIFEDANFNAITLNHASDEGVRSLGELYARKIGPVTKSIGVHGGLSDGKAITPDPDKAALYTQTISPAVQKFGNGEAHYTLTEIPSPKDAEIDGMDYDDYIKLFFEMCDQPWDSIDKAQQSLIEEFNTASKIRITNDDGTDISMELVEDDGSHYTFCNSLIAKNVPGSEIFSAPRADSVNGTIVAKGKFKRGGRIIEDLTMTFNQGRLVDFVVGKNGEAFEEIVSLDEGARFVGELGIGTNPHLKRHVANGLLVEKIGGSFHVALGDAYKYTEYEGVPVKVNNGNESKLHWDITTMLHGKGGVIELDGRKIMEDGQWIDPKYDVLNRGWEAVPANDRPPYWQKKLRMG